MSFSNAAITILLAMMAFYVFLSVYMVFHLLSRYFWKGRQQHDLVE